jgi:PKD repeat protein
MKKALLFSLITVSYVFGIAQKGNFCFIENKGQLTNNVKFYTQSSNVKMFLTNTGIIYQWVRYKSLKVYDNDIEYYNNADKDSFSTETFRAGVTLLNANPKPKIEVHDEQKSYLNFYLPQCPNGTLNVKHYKKLVYKNIYNGIDWVWKFTDDGIKYDFIVHPGADYRQIQLQFDKEISPSIDREGNLRIENILGNLIEEAPITFNDNKIVESNFVLKENTLSFSVSDFNPAQPLLIDPTLIWVAFQGTRNKERAYGSAIDSLQNLYVAGSINSNGFTDTLSKKGYQIYNNGGEDGFITKFNIYGEVVWSTYFGGTDDDIIHDIASDKNGNLYVVGQTKSTTVIAYKGYQNNFGGGLGDGFIGRFNDSGYRVWSSYYGGSEFDRVNAVTIDNNNDIVFGGSSSSYNNIAFNGHINIKNNTGYKASDGFFAKFDTIGTRTWATYIRGRGATDLTTDSDNNIFVVGTSSKLSGAQDLGISNYTHQDSIKESNDSYLIKYDKNCTPIWGTFYGGLRSDNVSSVTVNKFGNIFISGVTTSRDGIYENGFKDSSIFYKSPWTYSHFLAMFDKNGYRKWGTFYSNSLYSPSVACDSEGRVILTGTTVLTSPYMIKNAFTPHLKGVFNGYMVQFDSLGKQLWGSYFGGSGNDFINSITFNKKTNTIYVAGETEDKDSNDAGYGTATKFVDDEDILIGKIELDFISKNDSFLVCENITSIITDRAPSLAFNTHWYANSTDTTPIFTGDNFIFTTPNDTAFWTDYIQIQGKDTSRGRGKKVVVTSPTPVANFTVNDDNQCFLGNKVTVTNLSTVKSGDQSFMWDFGDGFTSTDTTPSHSYAKDSTYTIMLLVNAKYNCEDTIIKFINIHPEPVAIIDSSSINLESCLGGNKIDFISNSTISSGTLQHIWFFGDGDSTADSTYTHSYTFADTFNVSLIAASAKNCYDTGTTKVIIHPQPEAIIAPSSRDIEQCFKGNNVSLVSNSTLSSGNFQQLWLLGDGDSATTPSVNHTYGSPNNYTVFLVVTSNLNCFDSASTTILIHPQPLSNSINGGSTAPQNSQQVYSLLTPSLNSKYTWVVTGGTINGSSANDSVIIDWGAATSGNIICREENEFGCTDTVAIKNISLLNTSVDNIRGINYSVYPIPANNLLVLKVNKKVAYTVTDVLGKKVATGIALPSTDNRIETSQLNNGVYLLQLHNENSVIATQKIVVRH